jgi:hypothetical protein
MVPGDKHKKREQHTTKKDVDIGILASPSPPITTMGKKPKHRLKHVPPGPCGVWFQATQAKKKQRRNSNGNHHDNDNLGRRRPSSILDDASVEETPRGPVPLDHTQHPREDGSPEKDQPSHHHHHDPPSAWQVMQSDTGVTTPYNPTPWTTMSEHESVSFSSSRYEVVRSNLPDHYVTLWEIVRGDHDMKLSPHQRLRVLVHAVNVSNRHNDIWTVDLRDDTGASIKAWMEPGLIQEQLRNSSGMDEEMSMVRPGLVWMLRGCSMIIRPSTTTTTTTALVTGSSRNNSLSEERLERILLVAREHIEKIWYPEGKKRDMGSTLVEQTQNSQSSGNDNDDPVINLETQSAYKTPPGARHFGNGEHFAQRTPLNNRSNVGTTQPLRNDESENGQFCHGRATEQHASIFTQDNDTPRTQELSQVAAPKTREDSSADTFPKGSSQTSRKPPQHQQHRRPSQTHTALNWSIDPAAAPETQENPNRDQYRMPKTTNPSITMEPSTGTSLYTQESKVRNDSQQPNRAETQHDQHQILQSTPPPRKDKHESHTSSSRRRKKRKKSGKSPVRTSTTMSPMSQESFLVLTPSNPRRRTAKAASSSWSKNWWNTADPVVLEMMEDDEQQQQREPYNHRDKSGKSPPSNDSDSDDSGVFMVPKRGNGGPVFDPSIWEGVDTGFFDDDRDEDE